MQNPHCALIKCIHNKEVGKCHRLLVRSNLSNTIKINRERMKRRTVSSKGFDVLGGFSITGFDIFKGMVCQGPKCLFQI